MTVWLEIVGITLLIVGVIFCVLPVIPGQVLAFGALALKHFYGTTTGDSCSNIMLIMLLALIIVTVLDYMLPVWLIKKSGGSKYGSRGAWIGMFAGIVFTPVGMLLGMFLGAFFGELMANSHDAGRALKIGAMTFLGFLLSTGLKIMYAVVCIWFYFTVFAD